jgi:hypothetical protein
VITPGTEIPVGVWLDDTEHTTVVTALLADLVPCVWLSGSKALVCSV